MRAPAAVRCARIERRHQRPPEAPSGGRSSFPHAQAYRRLQNSQPKACDGSIATCDRRLRRWLKPANAVPRVRHKHRPETAASFAPKIEGRAAGLPTLERAGYQVEIK